MWLTSWLRGAARKPQVFRPRLESLECRDLLSFGSPITTAVSQPAALVLADINGDGTPDLIAAPTSGIIGIEVMLGKKNGRFGNPTYDEGLIRPTTLAVTDVNGDGRPDILSGNAGGSGLTSIGVVLSDGTGHLAPIIQGYSLAFSPILTSLAVADFNGDGKNDVAAVSAVGQMDVTLNTGGGTFLDGPFTYVVEGYPFLATVATGDLNGDGKPDLAVGSGTVSVFLNRGDGTGTFLPAQSYTVPGSATSVAVGDFNGDGQLDLVTANGTDNSVSVFMGTGDGTFGAAQTYAVGGTAKSIAVADFNKDGKLDIVTTGGEMDVLLNSGAGTFGTAQQVGPAGRDVVVADVNGDGFADLAQIDATGTSIDVLLNKADSSSGSKGHK